LYENEKINTFTDYKAILTFMDRNLHKKRNIWDEMLWNSKGAYKVPISGSTPLGLPKGMFLFEKNKKQRFV